MSGTHDWLNLLEVSGPFLAVPVLRDAFPQGFEELDSSRSKRLRSAYEEWRDAVDGDDVDRDALHAAWIAEVLLTALEADDQLLKTGTDVPTSVVQLPEHETALVPEFVFVDPARGGQVLAPIHVFPPDTDLSGSLKFGGLSCSAGDRMAMHVRALAVPFGIVTNGERWMLVHAPTGQVATFASWYARIWGQEPATLRAFMSLLGVRRFFAPEQDRLPALFERSLKHQDEVTDALGDQVRRAIEVLVQALDRADQDRNRELLRDVKPQELYEAGLTVMMRLVFLLAAEERGLLMLGEPRYDAFFAASTLRMQLRAQAHELGDEILERRRAAWSRLLAVFRAVFGGIDHPTLRLPAMGGSLFDPDRFPFLEGRLKGTSWRRHRAEPLPIDDRTVLLLLDAIQTYEGRTLSYRALDVEQIGHVYEGLLERTVSRVDDVTLELEAGASAKDARVTLGELESAHLDGKASVMKLLVERSKRSQSAIEKGLAAAIDPQQSARLLSACRGDVKLRDRLEPYVRLLRADPWGYPLVHPKGAFVVVLGADRRETGTHYTPKSLTELIVEETLTPIVYDGPSRGVQRDEWKLKTPEQLLDLKVCDPAMGSGAFLVQACRFLSARLVEAWAIAESAGGVIDLIGKVHEADDGVERMPPGLEARADSARRIVAERCIYGVDLNPLAVELAKLSLWLVTLSKGRPFGFLDHNLRCGDSILGVHRLDQLTKLSMTPAHERQRRMFGQGVERSVRDAQELRLHLREIPIRDIRDVEEMAQLESSARRTLQLSRRIADAFIGEVLASSGVRNAVENAITRIAIQADRVSAGDQEAINSIATRTRETLSVDSAPGKPVRTPFHWPLEFPEVFARESSGFDALVGNPPFLGNRLWKGALGAKLQWQCRMVLGEAPGKIDLSVVFHRRALDLLRSGGCYGMLATSNIAEGSAIEVGLGVIVRSGSIFFARKGMPWPGSAAVLIAIVGFFKGDWRADCEANGQTCERIGPKLTAEAADVWVPQVLVDAPFAFAGVDNSRGLAFVVTPDSPWFQQLKNESDSLLRPYISGDDITSSALTRVDSWALDIGDLGLDVIQQRWPVAYRFLIEEVQPSRTDVKLKSYKGLIHRWWQFWNHRAEQMRRIRRRDTFIGYSKNTKYAVGLLAPSSWIYTNKVLLLGIERDDLYAISLGTGFREWLGAFRGGPLGGTPSLSISESVVKYPQPERGVSAAGVEAAADFNQRAIEFSRERDCGLTEVMNAIHRRDEADATIAELRRLMEVIDGEVFAAYQWDGVDHAYDFQANGAASGDDRWRWSLPAQTISAVLGRLLNLNRERFDAQSSARPKRKLSIQGPIDQAESDEEDAGSPT